MSFLSPRHRFQFSLRTLLIAVTLLAVLCGYVAHEAKIVATRTAWLVARPALSDFPSFSHIIIVLAPCDKNRSPSFLRRWFGDERQEAIEILGRSSAAEVKQITALFPEATVFKDDRRH
ncbi:MAG TPA: hypothetical protein VGY55_12315 [Pirellulales bacterium]|nr:hypothetical protein [Pirellulales bacterium]